MQILKVTGGYPPAEKQGGTAVVAHDLSKALVGLGHNVKVFTTNANGDEVLPVADEWQTFDSVDVYYASLDKSFLPYKSSSMLAEFDKYIESADLVLLAGVWVDYAPKVVAKCKKMGKPVFLYTHGVRTLERMKSQSYYKKLLWWQLYDKAMFTDVTGIVAITSDEKEELLELGVNSNITVIPNGVSDQPFVENAETILSQNYGINEPYIYFLGRTEPIKGIELLIESFEKMSSNFSGTKLVISGPDRDGYADKMKEKANSLGIGDRVIFTGAVKGEVKSALYQNCSGFALLSITEVLAMSALEALKYQKPVVVTDKEAFSEFIDRNCMLGVDRDPSKVAKIFESMLSGDESIVKVGVLGKGMADSCYSWSGIAEKTVDTLSHH